MSADGSFAARLRIIDVPTHGTAEVGAVCAKADFNQYGAPLFVNVSADWISVAGAVPITVSTPNVANVLPTTVTPGAEFEIHAECLPQPNTPYQSLVLYVDPAIGGEAYLPPVGVIDGRADGNVEVPSSAAPGAYAVTPACIQRTPDSRIFRTFTLTIVMFAG